MPVLDERSIDDIVKEVKLEQRSFTPEGQEKPIQYNVVVLYLDDGNDIPLTIKGENKLKLQYAIKALAK